MPGSATREGGVHRASPWTECIPASSGRKAAGGATTAGDDASAPGAHGGRVRCQCMRGAGCERWTRRGRGRLPLCENCRIPLPPYLHGVCRCDCNGCTAPEGSQAVSGRALRVLAVLVECQGRPSAEEGAHWHHSEGDGQREEDPQQLTSWHSPCWPAAVAPRRERRAGAAPPEEAHQLVKLRSLRDPLAVAKEMWQGGRARAPQIGGEHYAQDRENSKMHFLMAS